MVETPPLPRGINQLSSQTQEPIVVQLDPKWYAQPIPNGNHVTAMALMTRRPSLQSALREFFEPLRTDDPRTDFFAVYRKESDEFDRDYTRKYDGDLNTSLIFAGLFSAVSSAFIIDVQSKLEPDPNDAIASYMKVLIHAANDSLYTDADPDSVTWTGPPPEIVTTQSLLYASLATSLFAAFLAMLGKQWVTWYLRNRGGSAADKSRDRQRKLDGLESWYFHIVIESLPVMLQLALLLLSCALSRHLWSINRTVAGVAVTATLLGATIYTCFTLAAILFHNCPYQTPASFIIRFLVSQTIHKPPLVGLVTASRRFMKEPRRLLRRFRSGLRSVTRGLGCNALRGTPTIPFTNVTSPIPIFLDTSLDLESLGSDLRCVAWVLYSTTDDDVIFSTVKFAADQTLYPEIAGILSSHVLTDLFFECLLDRRVVLGRAEQASLVGMTLASTLSIQLIAKPDSEDLNQLCQRIVYNIDSSSSSDAMFQLVVSVLEFIAPPQVMDREHFGEGINTPPKHWPVTFRLWLGRIILQTAWRWRRLQDCPTIIDLYWISKTCKSLVVEGDQIPTVFKTVWVLTLAICLGVTTDIRDLYPPNNDGALFGSLDSLDKQLRTVIRERNVHYRIISTTFSTLSALDIPQVTKFQEVCISWLGEIVNSAYPPSEQYVMTSSVVELLWRRFNPRSSTDRSWNVLTTVRSLLDFLLSNESPPHAESPPYPEVITLQVGLVAARYGYLDSAILPVLARTLLPTHPLRSRTLALRLFQQPGFEWYSSHSGVDHTVLLDAVGDPFQFIPDLLPQDGQTTAITPYDPMWTTILLIELASSDIWRNNLRRSNFTSCEEMTSTEEGRDHAFRCMIQRGGGVRTGPLNSLGKLVLAIKRLEELECWNTADVIILWACTNDDMNTHGPTGREILNHHHPCGMERRRALSRHIRVGVRQPARIQAVGGESSRASQRGIDFSEIPRACQMRRLYQLFGCDPIMWEEAVGLGK